MSLSPLAGFWPRASLLFCLTAGILALSIVLGGGTVEGFFADTLLQLAALPLLLFALWRLGDIPLTREMKLGITFCAILALVPLLQLVPLPPWLWTILPNRDVTADTFKTLGVPLPWLPVSVAPEATWISFLSLVPPIAIFLGAIQLSYRERRLATLVLLAVGSVSVFVGLIQVAQGPESAWRFFEFTNKAEAVGFFANRNHFAALIYSIIPIAAVWTIHAVGKLEGWLSDDKRELTPILGVVAGFTVLVVLLAGGMMARSRTGLALTIIALFGVLALAFARPTISIAPALNADWWRRAPQKLWSGFSIKILLAAIALALTFSFQFALFRIQERFSNDISEDARHVYVPVAIKAAKAYMPFGSGSGTFVSVYPLFERPEDTFPNVYANRAHNDAVEVWLETGVVGLILMATFIVWWAFRVKAIWRHPHPPGAAELDWLLARAGTIIVPLILVHSLFDYPLRTSAMAAVMAFACSLLIPPAGRVDEAEWAEDETPEPRRRERHKHKPIPVPSYVGEAPAPSPSAQATRTPAPLPPELPASVPRGPVPVEDRRWGADINWPKEWSNSEEDAAPDADNRRDPQRPPGKFPWR